MSIISANTLFHFTHTQDTLLKILEFGFRPSYCREFGEATNHKPLESYIPMVCFCDLPLSSIEKHSHGFEWDHNGNKQSFKGYGKFGLGLSKEWGIDNRLNPVTYINTKSHYVNYSMDLNEGTNKIIAEYSDAVSQNKRSTPIASSDIRNIPKYIIDKIDHMRGSAINIFSYMKPYNDFTTGQRYYNEREWRFVIPFDITATIVGFYPVISNFSRDSKKEVDELQLVINSDDSLRLKFEPNDIKYIIVDNDNDIKALIDKMNSLPDKFKAHDIERLTTRILTSEQIHEDF